MAADILAVNLVLSSDGKALSKTGKVEPSPWPQMRRYIKLISGTQTY